ncbi:MAG: CHAT domain-containing protein [Lewinella sp.]
MSISFRPGFRTLTLFVGLLMTGHHSMSLQAQGREPLDSLRQLLADTREPSQDRAHLLHEIGKILDDEKDHAAAIVHTEEALTIRLQYEEEDPEAVLLSAFNLGIYYNRAGQYQEAIDHYDMVLHRGPNRKIGPAYFQLGRCYRNLGEFEASALAYREAGNYAPFVNNAVDKAALIRNAGAALLQQEDKSKIRQAANQLRSAVEMAKAAGAAGLVLEANNDLGLALVKLQQYEEAIKLLRTNLEQNARTLQDEVTEAVAATHLGLAYRRAGHLELAKQQYERALAIDLSFAEGYQPDEYVAVDYDNLSTLFLTSNEPDSALHYASLALDWHLEGYNPSTDTELPSLTLMTKGDHLPTLTYLTDKGRAHQALANRGEQQHYEHALATYRRADELLDLLRQNQLLENTRTFWRADARELYELALDAAVAAGDPVSAFYFLEKARARLLLDELSAERASEKLPEDIQERLDLITRKTRLAPDDTDQLQRFRTFQDSIFTAFPRYAEARLGAPPPDPAKIARILGKDRTLVEYFVSDEKALALRWSADQGLAFIELPAPDIWRQRLLAFRQSLTDRTAEVSPVEARFLYAQLIGPLRLEAGTPLTIVPDGDLYLLPFGALLTDAVPANTSYQDWPWLANDHDINYAFSVQLIDFARDRRGRGNGRVLALAPVARLVAEAPLDPSLELPATLRTVRHLSSLFPADTLVNAQASPDAFRERADAYSLLHLGTHAYVDDGGSFLLYGEANAQRYTMNNLADHDLQADLVVMGACETGMGEQLIGEGIASLGRGFARRGAPALVMSLWSIDDATTAELLNATYDELAAASGPAAALYAAGNNYRTNVTNPRFGHPYYWAGLVYYGPEMPLEMGTTGGYLLLWLLAGLGLVVGCWWITKSLLKAL